MRFKPAMTFGSALALAAALAAPAEAIEPPANDTYDGRTVIDLSVPDQTLSFNLGGYTGDADDDVVTAFAQTFLPGCADVAGPASAWFEFTPRLDGSLELFADAMYGAAMIVVSGTLEDLVDLESCASRAWISVEQGTTYTVLIMEYVGDPEHVDLGVHFAAWGSLEMSVDAINGVDPKSGSAVIRGTFVCERAYGEWLTISVNTTQEKGKANTSPSGDGVWYGLFQPAGLCNGDVRQWSVEVEPTDGLFKSGSASLFVLASVEDETGGIVDSVFDGQVRLSPKNSLR